MPARLRVTNIPLHIRKEEFARIFETLEGCLECRLVNENDKPVGYVVFVDERFAGMAQSAYHLWQGFGNGGLMVDMLVEHRPDGGGPPQDSQYRGGGGPLKRPPVDSLGAPPSPSSQNKWRARRRRSHRRNKLAINA